MAVCRDGEAKIAVFIKRYLWPASLHHTARAHIAVRIISNAKTYRADNCGLHAVDEAVFFIKQSYA